MRNVYQNYIEVIMNYFGKRCIYCGAIKKLHIHHIIPLSRGGHNILGNLEIVCISCHSRLHHQIQKAMPIQRKLVSLKCKFCKDLVEKKVKLENPICEACAYKKGLQRERERYQKNKKI